MRFSFLDGKLVAITMELPDVELEDKWIDPDDLEQLFGLVFKPSPREYGRNYPLHLSFMPTRQATKEG